MHIKKEPYRKFEKNLFLHMAFEQQEYKGNVESQEAQERQETVEDIAKKDLAPKIQEHKNTVDSRIRELKNGLQIEQQSIAEEFFAGIQDHVNGEFQKLNDQYHQGKERIGAAKWEDSREERQILKRAQELAQEMIKNHLYNEKAIQKSVQDFLENMPNPESKKEEKDLIKDWIDRDPDLKEYYGEGKYLEEVLEIISQKYDIRFDEKGKVIYGADLLNKKIYPRIAEEGQTSLKKAILEDLKKDGNFSPDKIRVHEFEVVTKGNIRRIEQLRKEIDKGSIRALGGEINEWKDWKNHKGVNKLRELNKPMEEQIQKIMKEKGRWEMMEKIEQARQKKLAEYSRLIEKVDLEGKFKQAVAKGYKEVYSEEKTPNPEKDDFTGRAVLESSDGKKITVEIDNEKRIILTVKNQDPSFESRQSFSNPEDFKKIDLVQEAKGQTENFKKNKEFVDKMEATLNQIKLDVLQRDLILVSDEELASPDFELRPAKFTMLGHEVLNISLSEGSFKVSVTGGSTIEGLSPEELPAKIKGLEKEIKKVANEAEKAKQEIIEQIQKDWPKLSTPSNLSLIQIKNITGDFTDTGGMVTIGEIRKQDEDKTLAATISMRVGLEGSSREYYVEDNGKLEKCDFIEGVNQYLIDHQEELAKIPEKPEALTGTPEEISMKEKAKGNLKKLMEKLYPDLAKRENPEFYNKFLNSLNGKNTDLVKRISETEDISKLELNKEELELIRIVALESLGESKAATELKKVANNPEMVKNFEKKGFLEWLMAYLETFPMISKFMEEGDYKSAVDAFKAANEHPDGVPGKLEETQKIYEKGIEKAKLSELSMMYHKPTGDIAKNLFQDTPFRGQLKDVIKERMGKILGPNTIVDSWDNNDKILVLVGQRKFELHLAPTNDGRDSVEIGEIKENEKTQYQKYDIREGLTGSGKTLERTFEKLTGQISTEDTITNPEEPKAEDAVLDTYGAQAPNAQ